MPLLEGRRSERVAYRAPVELLALTDGDEIPRRVIARTLDLGAGGMRLRAPVQMRVGAQVTCCVELDGQPTALPGRVAWMHRGGSVRHGDGHGMGICFEALGLEESALLQQVVERVGERSRVVELRFPGLAAPVQARAREREGGLRLSAKLPILARGAELAFRLDEEGPWLRARIGEAALREENAERRLEIDVDLIEPDPARVRKHARYPVDDEERHAPPRSEFTPPSAREQSEPRERVGPGELCSTGGRGASSSRSLKASFAPLSSRSDDSPLGAGPIVLLGVAGALLGLALLATHFRPRAGEPLPFIARPAPVQRPMTLPQNAPAQQTSPAPAAGTLPVVTSDSVQSEVLVREAATPQPQPEQTTEPRTRAPELQVNGDAVVLQLPFEGSLEGMRTRVWADPHALALDLPKGRTALALGRYPMADGDVTDVQLNARGDTLLVRVKVQAPIASYDVTAADGTLRVDFVRAR